MGAELVGRRGHGSSSARPGRLECDVSLAQTERDVQRLEARGREGGARFVAELCEMRERLASLTEHAYGQLTGWQTVQLARHPDRPTFADYIDLLVKDFCELHGDRRYADDRALVTGFGRISGHRVLLVGHNKGRDAGERIACRFGYAHPEGYRKALHKMKLAEKFGVPVVTWIDTPGAFPGTGAEERGIAQAIAENLMEMSRLRVPIICVVIGEGGSGGALGIGVGDRIAMLKHAYYSVITPEGCASILFKSSERAAEAADGLALRSADLQRFGLIDDIVDEPLGGAHRNPAMAAALLESYVTQRLQIVVEQPIDEILARRRERLRRLGSGVVCG